MKKPLLLQTQRPEGLCNASVQLLQLTKAGDTKGDMCRHYAWRDALLEVATLPTTLEGLGS